MLRRVGRTVVRVAVAAGAAGLEYLLKYQVGFVQTIHIHEEPIKFLRFFLCFVVLQSGFNDMPEPNRISIFVDLCFDLYRRAFI